MEWLVFSIVKRYLIEHPFIGGPFKRTVAHKVLYICILDLHVPVQFL